MKYLQILLLNSILAISSVAVADDLIENKGAKIATFERNPILSELIDLVDRNAFKCEGKWKCGQMTSCKEAYYYLETCKLTRLDRDKDGIPCETICGD